MTSQKRGSTSSESIKIISYRIRALDQSAINMYAAESILPHSDRTSGSNATQHHATAVHIVVSCAVTVGHSCPCEALRHEDVWGTGCIDPRILHFITRRRVVSLISGSLGGKRGTL
jgi:hypothetical protein